MQIAVATIDSKIIITNQRIFGTLSEFMKAPVVIRHMVVCS
jgi:hypothetical protein